MIAICSDCHGRLFWKDIIPRKDEFEKIIFLGDYLDPYGFEEISNVDALNSFKEILEFKKENSSQVILLQGNHDQQYAISKGICNCRCDVFNYKEIQKLFRDNFDLFEIFYKFEQNNQKFLFSHAGIADEWINKYFPGIEADKQLDFLEKKCKENNLEEIIDLLAPCSYYRGGWDRAGSIVWRDAQEDISNRFGYQIFGHTMLKAPYVTKNWACVDCKEVIILNNQNELCNLNGSKLKIYDEQR